MAAPSMKRRGTAYRGAPNRGPMRCPMFDERGPGARWPQQKTNTLFAGMLGLRDNAQRPSPISSMTDPNQAVLAHMDKLGQTGVGLITLSGIACHWVVAQFPDGFPPTITESHLVGLFRGVRVFHSKLRAWRHSCDTAVL